MCFKFDFFNSVWRFEECENPSECIEGFYSLTEKMHLSKQMIYKKRYKHRNMWSLIRFPASRNEQRKKSGISRKCIQTCMCVCAGCLQAWSELACTASRLWAGARSWYFASCSCRLVVDNWMRVAKELISDLLAGYRWS